MRGIGALGAIGVLAFALAPTPSAAFGLRLGPFYLGLPIPGPVIGPRYRNQPATAPSSLPNNANATADAANGNSTTNPAALKQISGSASPVVYPGLALPAIYDGIFHPGRPAAAWPLDYAAILQTAFAKGFPNGANCQPPADPAAVVSRIGADISVTAAQRQLLQKLGAAIGMAAGYLAQSCPTEIPSAPIARLQLMESQIEKLSFALDIVRPPLQEFEQSLSPAQQARFVAVANGAGRDSSYAGGAANCGATAAQIDQSVADITQSVQPNDEQRTAISDIRQALGWSASDLEAHCSTVSSTSAVERLVEIEARLDAAWRAALALHASLATLEARLSNEQRGRLNAMEFAALH